MFYLECLDYKSLYGLRFFDDQDILMLEVGKFDKELFKEIVLADDEVIVGITAHLLEPNSAYYQDP